MIREETNTTEKEGGRTKKAVQREKREMQRNKQYFTGEGIFISAFCAMEVKYWRPTSCVAEMSAL